MLQRRDDEVSGLFSPVTRILEAIGSGGESGPVSRTSTARRKEFRRSKGSDNWPSGAQFCEMLGVELRLATDADDRSKMRVWELG